MKNVSLYCLIFFCFLMTASQATAGDRVNFLEEHNIEQKIQQLGEEWQRHFVETVNLFLEKELQRLRKDEAVPRESLSVQIQKYEDDVKRGPNDPNAFFTLSGLYDKMGDGANAIINAKKAEKIFVEQKNVKGAAEARRGLRHYFEKYDYKPEDFELTQ